MYTPDRHVCMYICMYVVCTRMYVVCMYICMYVVCMYVVCMYICMYVVWNTKKIIRMYVCMYVGRYIYTQTYHICTHAYNTYTFLYMYTHIHIHIQDANILFYLQNSCRSSRAWISFSFEMGVSSSTYMCVCMHVCMRV
jgi:hypothetical protein